MKCPECNSEMSKKWNPGTAKTVPGAAVVWECGVCGCQLTQADLKLSAKQPRSLSVSTLPLTTV